MPDIDLHYKIDPSEFLHTLLHSRLHALDTPHINRSQAQDLGAPPRGSDVLGHVLRFLDISPDDASVSAEMDHGSDLGATDGASATGAKNDLVFWDEQISSRNTWIEKD